ncbi:MAG: AAA family ATPase [Clostridiales bacterium]|nr:AAA family ATPase [Clostridiales bacterium]
MRCFSRPRRFGKSFAANMLCAYYSKGFDSQEMFEGLEISRADSFETYMNKLNVIYIDVTRTISRLRDATKVVSNIESEVVAEIRTAYPDCVADSVTILAGALIAVTEKTGDQFFIIIDEWDALFREAKNDDGVQKEYVQLLRGLFKGGPATDEAIAGAYMTGILPIKKHSYAIDETS